MDGEIRWVPHKKNAVDCLTKVKGNMESLLNLMRAARYTLVGEEQAMRKRAAYRAATGKSSPRAKRSGISQDAEPIDSETFDNTFLNEGVGFYSSCKSRPSTSSREEVQYYFNNLLNWGVTYGEEWTESGASSRSHSNSPPPSSPTCSYPYRTSLINRWTGRVNAQPLWQGATLLSTQPRDPRVCPDYMAGDDKSQNSAAENALSAASLAMPCSSSTKVTLCAIRTLW